MLIQVRLISIERRQQLYTLNATPSQSKMNFEDNVYIKLDGVDKCETDYIQCSIQFKYLR